MAKHRGRRNGIRNLSDQELKVLKKYSDGIISINHLVKTIHVGTNYIEQYLHKYDMVKPLRNECAMVRYDITENSTGQKYELTGMKEALDFLGVSQMTLYKMVKTGYVPKWAPKYRVKRIN